MEIIRFSPIQRFSRSPYWQLCVSVILTGPFLSTAIIGISGGIIYCGILTLRARWPRAVLPSKTWGWVANTFCSFRGCCLTSDSFFSFLLCRVNCFCLLFSKRVYSSARYSVEKIYSHALTELVDGLPHYRPYAMRWVLETIVLLITCFGRIHWIPKFLWPQKDVRKAPMDSDQKWRLLQ